MGLTTWKGAPDGKILKSDTIIAKNYLNEKMGGFEDKSKRFMYIYNRMVDVLMLIFERLKNEFSAKICNDIALY